jgi:hypothetical protein
MNQARKESASMFGRHDEECPELPLEPEVEGNEIIICACG